MAYNANIGVARAEFFPSISLTGMMGTIASSVGNLLYRAGRGMELRRFRIAPNYRLRAQLVQPQGRGSPEARGNRHLSQDGAERLPGYPQFAHSPARSRFHRKRACRFRLTACAALQILPGCSTITAIRTIWTVLDAERQLFSAELSLATALRATGLTPLSLSAWRLAAAGKDSGITPQFPIVDTMELLESEQAIGVPKHKKNK